MATLTFDTLAFVKRMQAAGMEPQQAEAFAEALHHVVLAKVVTTDHLDLRLKELENRLILKMGAMIVGSTVVTISVLGWLISLRH